MSKSLRSKEESMSDIGAEAGADEDDEQDEEAMRVATEAVAGGGGGGGGGGMLRDASWFRSTFKTSSTVLPASETT